LQQTGAKMHQVVPKHQVLHVRYRGR
jgi:hypothetical protein